MPVPAQIRERCRAFLADDEEIHYLIPAVSVSRLGGGAFFIVITAATIRLIYGGMFRRDKPQSLWASYRRTKRLGPIQLDMLVPTITLGSLILEIDDEYLPVIAAADAEISAPDYPPPNLL